MNYSVFRFTLNMHSNRSQVSIPVAYGDTAVKLYISLTDGGNSYFINDGCIAIISGVKADGTKFSHRCLVENNTTIVYEFNEQTTSFAGLVNCEVTLYGVNGKAITAPKFIIVVDEKLYYDTEVLSADDMDALQEIYKSEAVRLTAEAQRDAAENGVFQEDGTIVGGRVNAETERDTAEQSRIKNENERVFNEQLRKVAETKRDNAETERDTAERARIKAEEDRVEAEAQRKLDLDSREKKVDKSFFLGFGDYDFVDGYIKLDLAWTQIVDVVLNLADGYGASSTGRFSAICAGYWHSPGHYLMPYSSSYFPTHLCEDSQDSQVCSWYIPIHMPNTMGSVALSIKLRHSDGYSADKIKCSIVETVPSDAEAIQPIYAWYAPTSYLVKGNTIPLRDNVGHLQAAYPYYGDDVANKIYVDLNTIGWKSTPPKKGEPVLAVRFSGHYFIGGGEYYYGTVTEDQVWWIHRQGTSGACSAFDSEPCVDWSNYSVILANDTKSVTLYKKQTGWEVSPPGDVGGDATWWSSSADEFIETKVTVSKYLY